MSGKKKVLMVLVILLMLSSVAAGLVWHTTHYDMVDFRLYPKNARSLDLRGEEISVSHYEKLRRKLPDCEILWNVPFQEGLYPNDTTQITVASLTDADVEALNCLTELETVDASGCTDYAQLRALQEARPNVRVKYSVTFSDGTAYPQDAKELRTGSVTQEDVLLLQYLPELERVIVSEGVSMEMMDAFQGTAHNLGLEFGVCIDNQIILDTDTAAGISAVTDGELELLQRLHALETLHIRNPEATPEKLFALREENPQMQITWEVELGGRTFRESALEVDLSDVVVEDLAELEHRMAYLPNAQKLILGLCGIDNPDWGASKSKLAVSEIENEDLSAYRDRVREEYKVVWTVRLGPSIALRTDADNFMPNHYGVGRLFNDYAYNLRYCEDMVCLDVGHMTLTDISFVEFMPKLKYLILAWTEVQYIEPIRSCKNLIFLELDNSCIRDYSPLVDCTALQDLNIGKTFCDITPVLEMTWLKNLYMIFGDGGDAYLASQALPDTRVVATGDATVGGGWRRLQNYYDMRDMLGMYYMN